MGNYFCNSCCGQTNSPSQQVSAHQSSQTSSDLNSLLPSTTHLNYGSLSTRNPHLVSSYSNSSSITSQPQAILTSEFSAALTQSLIDCLPLRSYDQFFGACILDAHECVICMEPFLQTDMIRLLPCTHYYHKECVDVWFSKSLTCPVCLYSVDKNSLSPLLKT
eukprot:Sdes_comp22585_c0_seq1m21009